MAEDTETDDQQSQIEQLQMEIRQLRAEKQQIEVPDAMPMPQSDYVGQNGIVAYEGMVAATHQADDYRSSTDGQQMALAVNGKPYVGQLSEVIAKLLPEPAVDTEDP